MAQLGSFQGVFECDNIMTSSAYRELSVRQESVKSLQVSQGKSTRKEEAIIFLSSYHPLNHLFPLQQLRNSEHLRVKRYKQSIFYGEIQNGRKEGWGVMKYSDRKVYEGQWKNDKKNGQGTEKFPNKSVYYGQFKDGRPNGKGQYLWPSGQEYDGHWRNGEKHGAGVWVSQTGDEYDGEWRFGKPEGYGKYVSVNGDQYEGQFKEALRHGQGVQKFANGDMYRGNYINGKPSGPGNYYWSNGSYFKGHFLNGLRQGKGFWKKGVGSCDKYQGSYKNDKKWGYGEFTWSSGNIYKGNYELDMRNGYGQMFWTNGAFYKGEWLDGVQHGLGEIVMPGQGYKKGYFQNNAIVRVEKQELVTNSFREAHVPAKAFERSQTKRSQEESNNSKGNSFKRRRLVNAKSIINTSADKGKRCYFSEGKSKEKMNTVVHPPDMFFQESEKRHTTINHPSNNSRQNGKKVRLGSTSFKAKSNSKPFGRGIVIAEQAPGQSFVRSSKDRDKHSQYSQQRLLHSSFYLYKMGFRKGIQSRRYEKKYQQISERPSGEGRTGPSGIF